MAIVEERPGFACLEVTGPGAAETFRDEAGGHRFQRVPRNERRGRVHSSTVTVAVLDADLATDVQVADADLVWRTCRGSGAGGQHRNTTDSAVQLTHVPTGITVRSEGERSQHQNRATALRVLRARLAEAESSRSVTERNAVRRRMLGTGERSDKRRTVRVQDDSVVDHVTGRRWRFRDYSRGDWD